MDRETAQRMIANATGLEELLEAINAIEDAQSWDRAEHGGAADRLEDLVDITSLPNYGGEEPDDTWAVWSWDRTRLLVGEGNWEIVDRPDRATRERALIMALCREAGDDADELEEDELEVDFRSNHDEDDIRDAAYGDVAALARLRRACGLPVIG